MIATTYGTAHFVSVQSAINYYAAQEDGKTNARPVVALKIADGDIVIGRPLLRHGQTLSVINGRYHVTEDGR